MRYVVILFMLITVTSANARTKSAHVLDVEAHPSGDSGYFVIHIQMENKRWEGICHFRYPSCQGLAGKSGIHDYNFTMPDDPHDRDCYGVPDYYRMNAPGGECALVDAPEFPHQDVVYYIYPQ